MREKQSLRKQYKQIRDTLPPDVRKEASRAIFTHLTALAVYQNARTVLAYYGFGSEVQTDAIVRHAITTGKTLLLPVTDTVAEVMHPAVLSSPDALVRGGYGICEPADTTPYTGSIDLVLVPGLVFHRRGARIGYGKGYYDKFLSGRAPVCKVGLAYQCQICAENFGEPHDVRLDWIVTEKGGIVCGEG